MRESFLSVGEHTGLGSSLPTFFFCFTWAALRIQMSGDSTTPIPIMPASSGVMSSVPHTVASSISRQRDTHPVVFGSINDPVYTGPLAPEREDTTVLYTATPQTVFIRRSPSESAEVTNIVENCSELLVLQHVGGWLQVCDGWVPAGRWVGVGGGVGVADTFARTEEQEEVGVEGVEVEVGRPALPAVLSTSLPERGATSSRYCLQKGGEGVGQGVLALSGLDLAGAGGPTFKPCLPVQRGARVASQKRREVNRRAEHSEDYMWLLGDMAPSEEPHLSVTQVVLEETRPIRVATLLWAWGCAVVGILCYSVARAKCRNMTHSHSNHTVLVNLWVKTTEAAALLLWAAANLGTAFVQGTASRERWSILCDSGGVVLLLLSCLAFALSYCFWMVALSHTTMDTGLFFVSCHPALVLAMRAWAGAGSGWGERIGAGVIMLGSACFGLSEYLLPSEQRDHPEQSQPGLGVLYSLVSCLMFAVCLITTKHVRLQKERLHIPLTPLLLLLSMASLIGMTLLMLVGYKHEYHFTEGDDSGALGWVEHDVGEVVLVGGLSAVGLMGLFGALKTLPVVIISAFFALQPALIFLSDLATSSTDRPVPLPTQSVGVLCIIAGCICVCRSAITAVPLQEEELSSTATPRPSEGRSIDERGEGGASRGHAQHAHHTQRVKRLPPRRLRSGRSSPYTPQNRRVPPLVCLLLGCIWWGFEIVLSVLGRFLVCCFGVCVGLNAGVGLLTSGTLPRNVSVRAADVGTSSCSWVHPSAGKRPEDFVCGGRGSGKGVGRIS